MFTMKISNDAAFLWRVGWDNAISKIRKTTHNFEFLSIFLFYQFSFKVLKHGVDYFEGISCSIRIFDVYSEDVYLWRQFLSLFFLHDSLFETICKNRRNNVHTKLATKWSWKNRTSFNCQSSLSNPTDAYDVSSQYLLCCLFLERFTTIGARK